MPPNLGGFFMVRSYYRSEEAVQQECRDRKSGSAGMPRPISYAVFCLKKKNDVLGGGLELATATHIRVADESTFFGLPEDQRGIFVGGSGTVRSQRISSKSMTA